MKTKHTLITLALLALLSNGISAAPLGTAFTYQGKLASGGSTAHGLFDFTFTLYDDASGGTRQGVTLATNAVSVADGAFTVTLDFGAAFDGSARWLAIEVKTNGSGSLTPLTPRQPLTPTPYALHAANAGTLSGQSSSAFAPASGSSAYVAKVGDTMTGTLNLAANGLAAGGNQLTLSGGNVGIGTTTPAARLHVLPSGPFDGIKIGAVDTMGATSLGLSLSSPTSGYADIQAVRGQNVAWGDIVLNRQGGNVGIGTTSPRVKLHVMPSGPFDGINMGDYATTGSTWLGIRLSSLTNGYADLQVIREQNIAFGDLILNPYGGNIGIGTTTPSAKLDVNGTIQASGIINAVGGLVIENRTSDPPSPAVGQIWLRTDL
jgi:hypothetical protein